MRANTFSFIDFLLTCFSFSPSAFTHKRAAYRETLRHSLRILERDVTTCAWAPEHRSAKDFPRVEVCQSTIECKTRNHPRNRSVQLTLSHGCYSDPTDGWEPRCGGGCFGKDFWIVRSGKFDVSVLCRTHVSCDDGARAFIFI